MNPAGEVRPKWDEMAYRLISLWALMYKFDLGKFTHATGFVAALQQAIKTGQWVGFPERDYYELVGYVETIHAALMDMDLGVSAASADRVRELLKNYTRTPEGHYKFSVEDSDRIKAHAGQILARMGDEFRARVVLVVPPSKAAYYDPQLPDFAPDVLAKFANHTSDMFEAGNCFALGRNTACVFHLMRLTEAGVQAFGTKLGVTIAGELEWQKILDRLNPIIRAMNHRDPLTIQYAAIQSHLYNVKVAWRNAVMHPKETYDESEARDIFNHVRAFLAELVKVL